VTRHADVSATVQEIKALVEYYGYTLSRAAETLGLSRNYVYKLSSIHNIRHKKEKKSKEKLTFCPECLETKVYEDPENGERVCQSCGYVLEQQVDMVHKLPFDQTYAMENDLVFNKSLGDTLPSRHLYTVLAKVDHPDGKIPVHQIRAITTIFDPPLIRKMKEYAENFRKQTGLNAPNPYCDPDLLSVELGRLVQKVGNTALSHPYWRHRPRDLALACFHKAVRNLRPGFSLGGRLAKTLKKDALTYVSSVVTTRRR